MRRGRFPVAALSRTGGVRILFISAEVSPFAKTGGLADVAGALPKALAALGHDVRIATPAYGRIEHAAAERRWDIAPHPVTLRVPVAGGVDPRRRPAHTAARRARARIFRRRAQPVRP